MLRASGILIELVAEALRWLRLVLRSSESIQASWPGRKVGEPTPAVAVAGIPLELAKNLANFDDLDFHVYTGQQWENFHKSHGRQVIGGPESGAVCDASAK
jgi:hypothetical protein